jgi:hypothetical protein
VREREETKKNWGKACFLESMLLFQLRPYGSKNLKKRQMNEQLVLDLFLKDICSSNAYIGKLLYFYSKRWFLKFSF